MRFKKIIFIFHTSIITLSISLRAQDEVLKTFGAPGVYEICGQTVKHLLVGRQMRHSCGLHAMKNAIAITNYFLGHIDELTTQSWLGCSDYDETFTRHYGDKLVSAPKKWALFSELNHTISADKTSELVAELKTGTAYLDEGLSAENIFALKDATYTKMTMEISEEDLHVMQAAIVKLKSGEPVALILDDADLVRREISHSFALVIRPDEEGKRVYYLMDSENGHETVHEGRSITYDFASFFGSESSAQKIIEIIESHFHSTK